MAVVAEICHQVMGLDSLAFAVLDLIRMSADDLSEVDRSAVHAVRGVFGEGQQFRIAVVHAATRFCVGSRLLNKMR